MATLIGTTVIQNGTNYIVTHQLLNGTYAGVLAGDTGESGEVPLGALVDAHNDAYHRQMQWHKDRFGEDE